MILAVLDARAGLGITGHDVYLNVAGGLKIAEPAADLAAAAALISSFSGRPLPRDCVFFGEISLSGDVRPAPQAELRLKEAAKLGFTTAVVPPGTKVQNAGLSLETHRRCGGIGRLWPARLRTEGRAKGARAPNMVNSDSMGALSFSFVDVLVVAVILVSAGFAAWRGFVQESLSIFAWAAAAFAALYFGPAVVPLLKGVLSGWGAILAAYAGVFLIVVHAAQLHQLPLFRECAPFAGAGAGPHAGPGVRLARGLVIVGDPLSRLLDDRADPEPAADG